MRAVSCCVLAGVLLAGCAMAPMGPMVQVMPGPGKSFGAFQADDAQCRNFASNAVAGQAEVANQQAVGGAVLTTVLGAGLGAAVGGGNGAAVGAASGAGLGAGLGAGASSGAQVGIQAQYDNAYSQCMYTHGDQVPGYAPAVAYAPSGYAGSRSLVRAVQLELRRLGYPTGRVDGVAGPQTVSNIQNFEASHGLPVDGTPSRRPAGAAPADAVRLPGLPLPPPRGGASDFRPGTRCR